MDLINFELSDPPYAITLRGLGLEWDLHNFATFESLEMNIPADRATLRWRVPSTPNPWGSRENTFNGCELVFTGVRALEVTPRNAQGKQAEDGDLAHISRVIPGDSQVREQWAAGQPFHLRFEFQSGRAIEVDADRAELVGIA